MSISTKTSGAFALTRPPRTDDELYSLVKALWNVTIPRDKHCAEHDAPFTAFATAFFAREPQVLVRGSRGLSGKTQLMAALGLTSAVVLGCDLNLVGGSEQQALNALAHMKKMWNYEHSPSYMLKSNQTQLMRLTNGAQLQPLTASERSVRGPHPARLLLDEIDEMDESILESAKGQPMPQKNWMGVEIPAQTMMVSTLQYSDSTMAHEMRRFEEENLPIYQWCFLDTSLSKDGWLSPSFVEQKQREVSKERWRVEYLLGEPSIGNRAFDSAAVEATFTGKVEPLKKTRDFEQVNIEEPKLDRDYVIAADWAQAVDYTVIGVWDVTTTPIRLVYYVRMHRRPYPEMIGYFNTLQKKYEAQGIHDATGLGRVVADQLDGKVYGFVMAGRARSDMLTEYVGAVERGKISSPRIESIYKEHLFASTEDLYSSGKEFHLPDSVCMAALAWNVVSIKFPLVDPFGIAKTDMNWMARAVTHNRDHVGENSQWQEGVVHDRDAGKDQLLSFT